MDAFRVHFVFFFFNDTATTEIYTLSLHDALPISTNGRGFDWLITAPWPQADMRWQDRETEARFSVFQQALGDRKSTRLNSSHANISYAVFCLKKKKKRTAHLCDHPYHRSDVT